FTAAAEAEAAAA
nr:RecName: Full=Unknown protein 3 [Ichthyophis tricolor]